LSEFLFKIRYRAKTKRLSYRTLSHERYVFKRAISLAGDFLGTVRYGLQ